MTSVARILTLVLVCLVALVAGAWWQGVTWSDVRHWGTPRNVIETAGQTVRIPVARGPEARRMPAVPVTTQGTYAFLFPGDGAGGGPVRYDPCRPLAWVIDPQGMPARFEAVVHGAVASVSAATGLEFVFEGYTDERVSFDRAVVQDRYGSDRFAPIIVGFETAADNPALVGTVTGLGGSSAVPGAYGDGMYLRAGTVSLDSEDLSRIVGGRGGPALARAVVAHELGHVVGLAHVRDGGELMNESNLRLTDWGDGDLAGLALAGAGACEAR